MLAVMMLAVPNADTPTSGAPSNVELTNAVPSADTPMSAARSNVAPTNAVPSADTPTNAAASSAQTETARRSGAMMREAVTGTVAIGGTSQTTVTAAAAARIEL
jgi:hypothetical protein